MQALVVTPGREHSTRIEDVPDPAPRDGEVLLRVLEVGVCGTDREIDHGLLGVAPEREDALVIAHELLGTVERDAPGFSRGDLAVRTVRRSCGARRRWPDALERFVGLHVPLDRFAEAFESRAGKATLVVAE